MRRTLMYSLIATLLFWSSSWPLFQTSKADETAPQPAPVEESMHEFMEYAFQPTYRRLKKEMAKTGKDAVSWRAVKSDALILAEGGNLLLLRKAPENEEQWKALSEAVRSAGAQLYQAARKKDDAAASGHYRTMLEKCNACHKAFADGEHQLQP